MRIGARMKLGHRVQTLGMLASRASTQFAVVVSDLSILAGEERSKFGIDAYELITAIKIEGDVLGPIHNECAIADLADVDRLIAETVWRFHPTFGRVQGLITAIRGAVRMRVANQTMVVRGLVEVAFDASTPEENSGPTSKTATPVLEAEDAGCLVTTWSGEVIGILVAGAGRTGFVAPVAAFLRHNALEHRRVEPDGDIPFPDIGRHAIESHAGFVSQAAELAREERFGFDRMPELV